ncbi:MAG: DNA polymerase IV [Proteobacteria bacterium]|nr:DNA polymerase IV [Pseudomonadota bacterium]MCP4916948.1 DNA polymerase IV [Pseudomonadota bacterium]
MRPQARICCLDLDTFFVSVERLIDPSLKGRCVIVGAAPNKRGVVTACSYEVREYGVRSGMSATEAARLAPEHTVWLPGRFSEYSPYAKKVKAVLERFTPTVQTASIDEFFLDFSGCESLYRKPGDAHDDETITRTAWEMRVAIQDEVGLPASAGLGSSRSIAKIASGKAKPAGVWMVRAGQERGFLHSLGVRKLPGIGPVAEQKLHRAGITTLGQLLDLPPGRLRARFARLSGRLERLCAPRQTQRLGRNRPAFREHDTDGLTVGSISNERTFGADQSDEDRVKGVLLKLVERVCWRARKRDIRARTITLKLRYSDFQTLSRSRTIHPTNTEAAVYATIQQLYEAARTRDLPIRLLGVGLSNLVGRDLQLDLPFGAPGRGPVGPAINAVRERFGYDAVRLGAVDGDTRWSA